MAMTKKELQVILEEGEGYRIDCVEKMGECALVTLQLLYGGIKL